jgi:hypothetical protein
MNVLDGLIPKGKIDEFLETACPPEFLTQVFKTSPVEILLEATF